LRRVKAIIISISTGSWAIIINCGVCQGDNNIDITRFKAIIINFGVSRLIIISISPGSEAIIINCVSDNNIDIAQAVRGDNHKLRRVKAIIIMISPGSRR
jgi:hypothetical protein